MGTDLRDAIFASIQDQEFIAEVRCTKPGLVAGVFVATEKCRALNCTVLEAVADGTELSYSTPFLRLLGLPKALAMAEDCVSGLVAKASGVAQAAHRALALSNGRVRIVCGAAKKLDPAIKQPIRDALACGGVAVRMVDEPFIYLDKNYVRMFGSVRRTLTAVSKMRGMTLVIQLRGELQTLEKETEDALAFGANVLMVDTGRVEDLDLVARITRQAGRREEVRIAFAGNIDIEDVSALGSHDVDILGLGRTILDAPMADVTFDVVSPVMRD